MQTEPEEVRFRFARLFDYATILTTLRDERIYSAMCDDFAPPREAFMPRMDDAIVYVGCWEHTPTDYDNIGRADVRVIYDVVADKTIRFLGLWCFMPTSPIRWNVHTCLLPCAWGRTVEATKAMLAYVWENFPVERIVTEVPTYNRLALRLAKAVGMEYIGTDRQAIRKGGKLHDQILLGLSKCPASAVADSSGS